MKFHKDGTLPLLNPYTCFVFGSNLAGRHGAGAAKVAHQKYGAKYGIGVGFYGNSFAIPTKDLKLSTLNLEQIESFVNEFLKFSFNRNLDFFVTRIGCGLAGYKDEQIAPLFKNASNNCSFAEEWKKFLIAS